MKVIIILLGLSLSCGTVCLAQENSSFLNDNLAFVLNSDSHHIEDDSLTIYKHSTITTIVSLVYLETVILGYSYLSTYTWGSNIVGAAHAGGAALIVGFYIFSDYEMAPLFTIPYTIGLTALSYYNFRFADKHSAKRKFFTNFAGFNGAFFAVVLVAIPIKYFNDKNLKFRSYGSGISLVYEF